MSDSDFSSPTNITWHGHVGSVEYGGDKNMVAMFYNRPVHNPAKSNAEGRQIFEDQTYVRIHPPGERLNIIDRPAGVSDKRRFPMQWAQFQENKQQTPDGTPIDLLYPDQPSIGAMLRASAVFTIEQAADLSGPAIDNIGMGAQRYSNDAKKYLEAASKGVKGSQLRKELDERDSQIRTLTHKLETVMGEVRRLTELNAGSVDLAQVQALIAGQQGRPQYPQARQMAPQFDAQSALINATHHTKDLSSQQKSKRTRSRIQA